ncbi:anhydro-N-acetylmuramic acid kinase [Nioella nitratireducens]|uniref:anhydro-N-acetylmuramic acid kinase n=1 Tax=Nioella nitratireducens TaxID=1287720 RepID=UPI0008FD1578|nr:anhydro-N-acetylmuramic acid kinase [Nioella nitratireducens]
MEGPIWVAGAMSGTSLDGVDAAMLLTDGRRIVAFGETHYRAYRDAEREAIRAALGRWPGEDGVDQAAEVVETAHAAVLSRLSGAKMVGFHGQTLAHDPKGRGTHQAGDGQVLADVLGLPVVWDFRSSDVQLGGEGAPLAPYYHFACAQWIGASAPLVFLNLGGVGNLTWVDPRYAGPEQDGAVLAFDTGPGNAPLDDLLRSRRGMARDEGGTLALSGQVDHAVVAAALARPFLSRMPPKSLDRNDFADLSAKVSGLNDADAAATLVAVSVACVADGMTLFPAPPARVLVCGGGRHNAAMMRGLAKALPCPVIPVEDVGLDGDMLEAQAFAFLAVRVARKMSTSGPMTTGVAAQVGGGRISRPKG